MPAWEALARLADHPAAYALAFVVGALFGSFANVCILRIPQGGSIVRPPSHCAACHTPIRWYDNLPIASFIVLRGRCRACGASFSPRYLLVEAGMGMLVAATWHLSIFALYAGDPFRLKLARFAIYVLFELVLIVIAFIDLDHKLIPDRITYPAIPVFVGLGLLLGDIPWWEGPVGAALGYAIVRALSDGYYYLTRREGLGYGDGKLLSIVGGLLGWRAVLFALFGGSLVGSLFGVAWILAARRRPREPDAPRLRHMELPFGPFLVAATLVYLFLQEQVHVGWSLLALPGGEGR